MPRFQRVSSGHNNFQSFTSELWHHESSREMKGPNRMRCCPAFAAMGWFVWATDRRWHRHALSSLLWREHLRFRRLHSLNFSTVTDAARLYLLSNAHKHILNCCWEASYQSQNVCADGGKFRNPVTSQHMQGWITWRGWVIHWQAAFKILNWDFQGLKVIAFIGIPKRALCVAGVVELSAEGWMLL